MSVFVWFSNDGVAKKKGKKKAKTPPPASTSTDTASAVPPEGDEQEADVSGEETLEVNPEKNSSKTKRYVFSIWS